MPCYTGDYHPFYKNQPVKIREKVVEITDAVLKEVQKKVLPSQRG